MLSCIPAGHLACRIYAHLAYFHSTDTAMGKRGRDRMNEALEQEQQEEMAGQECEKLREECGVFGIYDPEGSDVAQSI